MPWNMVPFPLILWLIGTMSSIHGSQYCHLEESEIYCTGTDLQTIIKNVYDEYMSETSRNVSFVIEESYIYSLDYFPSLQTDKSNFNVRSLVVTNSSLGHVGKGALDELEELEELDLSRNSLKNVLFVRHLPRSLRRLTLSRNKIVYVDNVFGDLRLEFLDLSHNQINIVDFKNVFTIGSLDFSCNRILNLVPHSDWRIGSMNLSHNKIEEYSEPELSIRIPNLDLSYNKLKSVKLKCCVDKNFLDLSGNVNLTQFLIEAQPILEYESEDEIADESGDDIKLSINTLNVSFNSYNKMFEKEIFVQDTIILRNNNFTYLNNSTINLKKIIPLSKIDISNSLIMDISEYYFSDMHLLSLNLSYNRLITLGRKIFENSRITYLDLSYSQVKDISATAFTKFVGEELDLSHNHIEFLENIFIETDIKKLKLSHNPIQHLNNFLFAFSKIRQLLDISHCQIKEVQTRAFDGLEHFEKFQLDISHNNLNTLDSNTFHNLQWGEINLAGNNIKVIRNKAFNSLPQLRHLNLSSLRIVHMESFSFFNLSNVELVNLRNNSIVKVNANTFVDMPRLRDLYLDGNKITELGQFSNRLKIRNLTLGLKGNLTSNRISNLNLRYMNIKDSDVEVLHEFCFQGMYNLKSLSFEDSNIERFQVGFLNDLYNLKELDTKNLFKNVKKIERHTFKDIKAMESLTLSGLELQSLESHSFEGLQRLQFLYLDQNNLTGIKDKTFKGLEDLRFLNLSDNQIELLETDSFIGLSNLTTLCLENNNLNNVTKELFIHMPNLEILFLGKNLITTLEKGSFKNLFNLQELHLEDNYIDDLPIGIFQDLHNLTKLHVAFNRIKIINIGAFSNLRSLEHLDLSFNDLINLEDVSVFYSLKNLKSLWLDGNHLKNFEFQRFVTHMVNLTYIGISQNKWQCRNLSTIIEHLTKNGVGYNARVPIFNQDNIDGVGCIDICKFVYCSHENAEDTMIY